jgi:hypothetical protein
MSGLLHAHSGLRWIVIALMLTAIIKGFQGAKGGKEYTSKADKINLFAMIAFHTQVLIGLVLYFMNGWYEIDADVMANSATRFFAVEHIFGMTAAMAIITIGRSKSKKIEGDAAKFKKTATFYLIGFIIAMISIPWPFMPAARALF